MNGENRKPCMFEHERALNEFMVDYLERLVSDLDETDLDFQPFDDFNPPRWILGHLAINNDYALRILGDRFQCPKEWHRSFARGTPSTSRPLAVPSKDPLMERIRTGFRQVCKLTEAADLETMRQPHNVPFLKETSIKTIGQVISHLMTTHLATHVGQLSAWRRATRRPPVSLGGETP